MGAAPRSRLLLRGGMRLIEAVRDRGRRKKNIIAG